jgi:hypothetical protein
VKHHLGGRDALERRVGERKVVDVGDLEGQVGLVRRGKQLGTLDQFGAQIDPDGPAGGDQRGDDTQVVTGPAPDVEQSKSRT